MKTFYTIAISLLSALSFAQQTISFEDSEGFMTGDINGQGAWISTPTGDIPPNITNQMISIDNASDGSSSLKIVKEPIFGTQSEPIIGGFYNLPAPLEFGNFSVSFDINMSQLDGSVFGFQGVDSIHEIFIVRVDFDKTGIIKILNTISGAQTLVSTSGTWSPDLWYRFKVVGTSTEVKYYLNDVLIYTGMAAGSFNIDQLRFVHDNALGIAYIDNIKVNTELVMGVKDVKVGDPALQLYPNPAGDFIKIKFTGKIKYVEVFDVVGKNIQVKFNGDNIDIKSLPAGEYFFKISTDTKVFTEKVIKN
nr:T9SS type A sorting domain-containing protein [uncultured Chryseobacterium sp.]